MRGLTTMYTSNTIRRTCFADVGCALAALPCGPRRDALHRAVRIARSAVSDYTYGDPPDVYELGRLWENAVASTPATDDVAREAIALAQKVWSVAFAMPADLGLDDRDMNLPADLAAAHFSPAAIEWARTLVRGKHKHPRACGALRDELRAMLPRDRDGGLVWSEDHLDLDRRIQRALSE